MTNVRLLCVVTIVLLTGALASSQALGVTSTGTVNLDATVNNGTWAPSLDSPLDASAPGATPTLRARFNDNELDTGTLSFEVCTADSLVFQTCAAAGGTLVYTGSTSGGINNGTFGSVAVTPALAAGTYYWRARSTDNYLGVSDWTSNWSFTTISTPDITSVSPSSVLQGSSGVTVRVDGSGFVNGATVGVSDAGVTVDSVTWVSSTRVDVTLTTVAGAATGPRDVTLVNPDTGATTEFGSLSVTATQPTATLITPAAGAWVSERHPIFTARYDDPEIDMGRLTFELCAAAAADPWSITCSSGFQRFGSGLISSAGVASLKPTLPLADGAWYWRAHAKDVGGTSGASSPARMVQVDATQPTTPGDPQVTSTGPSTLRLTWTASSDLGIGGVTYDVQNSVDGTTWTDTCTNTSATICTFSGTSESSLGMMRVRACDGLDNCTDWQGRAGASKDSFFPRTTLNSTYATSSANRAATHAFGTTNTTTSIRHGSGTGWFPFRPGVADSTTFVGTEPATNPYSTPSGTGWVLDETAGKTVAPGDITFMMQTVSTQATGFGALQGRAWLVTTSAGSITSSSFLGKTTIGDIVNGISMSSTFFVPGLPVQTTLAANQAIYVELWLNVTTPGSGTATVSLAAEGSASRIDIPGVGTPPDAPTPIAPIGTTTQLMPTLSATYLHPASVTGALEFQVSTTPSFTTIEHSGTSGSLASSATGTFTTGLLQPATTYYWRSRGVDSDGLVSPWSSAQTFATAAAPASPSNLSPASGATTPSTAPSLVATTYSDSDPGDSHTASHWQLREELGSYTNSIADSGITSTDLTSWTVSPGLADMQSYCWRTRYRDSYGIWSPWSTETCFTVDTTFVVDSTIPTITFDSFAETSGGTYLYWSGGASTTMYYNPAFASAFDVSVNASDAESGLDHVQFPGLPAGWSGGGSVNTGPPQTMSYSLAAGSPQPANPLYATAMDFAGNSATTDFSLVADSGQPSGGSITVADATTNSANASISFAVGTDGESGIATHRLWRSRASYVNGACDTYDPAVAVGALGQASPYNDGSLATGSCYRYELRVIDNVGNERTYTSPSEVRVDDVAPDGWINPIPTGPVNGDVTLDGSITDTGSQPSYVEVDYTGPGAITGSICSSPPLGGAGNTRTWSCNFDVETLILPEGTYTIELTGYDMAGNAIAPTVTRTIAYDDSDPTITSIDFDETSNAGAQHAVDCTWPCTPKLYVNPAQTGTATLNVAGDDGVGTGTSNVAFPDIDGPGTSWTPAGGVDAGTSPYAQTYTFTGPGVTSIPTGTVTLFDNAGNFSTGNFEVLIDETAPVSASISNPPTYRNTISVPVTYASGNDGTGSGIATTVVQREDGTLSGDGCTMSGSWAPVTLDANNDTSVSDGSCYAYRLVVTDNVGNSVTTAATTVVKVDITAPSAPATRNDGAAADIDVTNSLSVPVNWTAGGDAATGIASYDVCLKAGSPTADCSTPVDAANVAGTSTSLTAAADGPYYMCVRSVDRAGNTSAYACSDGVVVDTTAPANPASADVFDLSTLQVDKDWSSSTTALAMSWAIGSDGGSGVATYDYCFSTSSANCAPIAPTVMVSGNTSRTATATATAMTTGTTYYTCVRTHDVAGNIAPAWTCSDGFGIDVTNPTAPTTVNDGAAADVASQSGLTVEANWTGASDAAAGISNYDWCVSTTASCGGTVIGSGTSAAASFSTSSAGMVNGVTYYSSARTRDAAGNISAYASSNGFQFVGINDAPDAPSALAQFRSDGTTAIANGSWINDTSVVLKFDMTDANVNQTLTPWVEMNTSGVFTATCGTASPGVYSGTTVAASTGSTAVTASVTVTGLANSLTYYWRACVVDQGGLASAWSARGGAPDFRVDGSEPTNPGMADIFDANSTYSADADFTQDATALSGSWISGTDTGDSGIGSYAYCFSSSNTNCTAVAGTGTQGSGDLVRVKTATANPALANASTTYLCVRATDNAGNVATSWSCSDGLTVDTLAPSGDISATPTGPVNANASLSGTISDTGSGPTSLSVSYDNGVGTTGPCSQTGFSAAAPTRSWTCEFPGGTLPDGTYTLTLAGGDAMGNAGATLATRTIVVDRTVPTITDVSFTEGTNANAQHAVNCATWPCTPRLHYNPAQSGTMSIRVEGTDAGSGTSSVSFNDIDGPGGTSWSPSGSLATGPSPYDGTFVFTAPASSWPGLVATMSDAAGNTSTAPYDVVADSTEPNIGTVDPLPAYRTTLSVPVTYTLGTDAESGTSATRSYVERTDCATMTATTTVTLVGGEDTSVSDESCYLYRVVTVDNVGNERVGPWTGSGVYVDTIDPTGTIDASPAGPVGSTSPTITGTITDTGSSPGYVELTWDDGVNSGTVCAYAASGPAWGCVFEVSGLADGMYTLTLSGADDAGNVGVALDSRTIVVDHTNPTITGLTLTEQTGQANQHVENCSPWPCVPRMWVNPALSGSVSVSVSGTDTDTGTSSVLFPDLDGAGGSAWSPAGDMVTGASPYEATYTFIGAGVTTNGDLHSVTLLDAAGNGASASFAAAVDGAAPTGATINNPPAYRNVTAVPVTYAGGADGSGSGVATVVVEREAGTLAGDACAMSGTWNAVPIVGGEDTNVQTDRCYRYRVVTTDNVGNADTTAATTLVRVDMVAPSGAIASTPTSPFRSTVSLSGTSGDVATRVAGVTLSYTGASSGTICSNMTDTVWAAPGCEFNTTLVAAGTYTLTATVTDAAGNIGVSTRTVVVDNQAPFFGVTDVLEVSGAQYQQLVAGTLWVNPAGSGVARVVTTASDTDTGVAGVNFPGFGGGWSPAGGGSVPNPGAYAFDYTFAAPVTGEGVQTFTATDNAGNTESRTLQVWLDSAIPVGGSITSSGGTGSTPTINFTVGIDDHSGVRTWMVERRSTSASAGVCNGGGWSVWAQVGAASPVSPMTDATVAASTCYQYRLAVIDNVENRAEFVNASTFITATPGVQVTPVGGAANAVTEGGGATSWTVVLSAAPTAATTVSISGGAKLATSVTSVTFTALDWNVPRTISATAVNDDVDSSPDTVTAQVSHQATSGDAAYVALAPVQLAVSVTDNDAAAIVASAASVGVAEPATSATVGIRLATRPSGTVVVAPSSSSGQASVGPATLAFTAANWNVEQLVTVTAVDDPDVDGTAPAVVSLVATSASDAPYAGLGGPTVTAAVADDDQAGVVLDASGVGRVSEASSEADAIVQVRLAARPSSDVRVAPTVADGELRAPTGMLTFTRDTWNVPQSVRIFAFDDPVAEATPHAGRVVFKAASDDAAFGALAEQVVNVAITDDDPARLLQRAGSGWTLGTDGTVDLREGGEGAVVSILADGDPTRTIKIEPNVSSGADVVVRPASAIIDPAAPNQAHAFTVTAVDDGASEDATESVRLTWTVTTVDPRYADAAIAGSSLRVIDVTPVVAPPGADPAPDGGTGTPDPVPPAGGTPNPDGGAPNPTPDPGGGGGGGDGTPPGSTVGDDGKTTTATGPATKPNRGGPGSHGDRGLGEQVSSMAKKHPVATSVAASGVLAAGAALAKPLLLGGKVIGSLAPGTGGGMGNLTGIGQLRRLVLRKKGNGGPLGRLLRLFGRRKRRGGRGGDDEYNVDLIGRDWADLFDPDKNRW